MSTEEEFSQSIIAACSNKDASALQVADAANATWSAINIALSPVIGQHGVVALFKRSLHLQKINYPLLTAVCDAKILPGEFPAQLHAFLAQQTNANALKFNCALLVTFYELLTNFIGKSLTRQLLHSIFNAPSSSNTTSSFSAPSSGDPAQDILS